MSYVLPQAKNWRACIAGDTAEEFRDRHRALALSRAARLPDSLKARIREGWDALYGIPASITNHSPVARANRFAARAVQDFGDARAGLAYDESAIRTHAENYAGMCANMTSRATRASFVKWFGIDPPEGKRITDAGACARMDDAYWWRRQLRKVWTRRAEDAMRRSGVIRKGRAPYASDEAVRHRAARQRRTREWMESRVMVNGEGEQLELLKLADKSLANPALRRGEFMCRMRGFEEIAADLGHVALFFTLTAPSAFHAQLSKGGANPEHARQTVRDAQKWLCKIWARARAKLARLSIQFYGFRVAEPHHDGTPHWHMVCFSAPGHADTLRRVLSIVWLSEFGEEAGASEHRCKAITIDPEHGSATGYVAKYVSKNIDGAGSIGDAISDETGEAVANSVSRVAAWASVHGVRQFQQIGGPPVGLWRECRRVRESTDAPTLERARGAADRGDWKAFIQALGGIGRSKVRVSCVSEKYSRFCEVTPETAHEFPAAWLERSAARRVDAQGREVLAVNRYGETPPDRACGVVSLGLLGRWASMRTRRHRWRIEKKGPALDTPRGRAGEVQRTAQVEGPGSGSFSSIYSDLGPVAITVRGSDYTSEAGVMNPPWSAARGHEAGNLRSDMRTSLICDAASYRDSAGEGRPPEPARDLSWIATVPFKPARASSS